MFLPLPHADVFTVRSAVDAGATSRQLEWAVRCGRLHRLRRGVLCRAAVWAAADATGRAALLGRAQVLAAPLTAGVISHVTAAALFWLPVPEQAAERVWVTLPPVPWDSICLTASCVMKMKPATFVEMRR